MRKSAKLFMSLVVFAFMLAGLPASSVMAQDKGKDAKAAPAAKAEKGKPTVTVLLENDKVRVYEARFKPGDVGGNVARPYRIARMLQGGTMQRTYADGKTDKLEYKTGEVRALGPDPVFTPKNIGKTDVVFYVVEPKQPK